MPTHLEKLYLRKTPCKVLLFLKIHYHSILFAKTNNVCLFSAHPEQRFRVYSPGRDLEPVLTHLLDSMKVVHNDRAQ